MKRKTDFEVLVAYFTHCKMLPIKAGLFGGVQYKGFEGAGRNIYIAPSGIMREGKTFETCARMPGKVAFGWIAAARKNSNGVPNDQN